MKCMQFLLARVPMPAQTTTVGYYRKFGWQVISNGKKLGTREGDRPSENKGSYNGEICRRS